MTYYAYAADHCGNKLWMSKHRGGPHRRHEEFGRGPGGPGGPGFGGPGFGPRGFGPGGPFGPGFGGPGGPFGGGRGRKRRGDVRIALLMLLAEQPSNGYQLMQTIEERSGGRWRPSPGSVYPALSQLEDEGFVHTVAQDSGRAFEITDAGRKYLEEREDKAAPWEASASDGPGANRFHELRSLIPGIAQAVWQVAQVGDEAQWQKAAEVLEEARRALYQILADERSDSPESPEDAEEA
jgi:DNA-binding PadR family transcriptional regulator